MPRKSKKKEKEAQPAATESAGPSPVAPSAAPVAAIKKAPPPARMAKETEPKFRSASGKDVHVAIGDGSCATVGNDWRELPRKFWTAALAQGCVTDKAVGATPAEAPVAGIDHIAEIMEAVEKVMASPDSEELLDEDGKPSLAKLSALTGSEVTEEMREEALQRI